MHEFTQGISGLGGRAYDCTAVMTVLRDALSTILYRASVQPPERPAGVPPAQFTDNRALWHALLDHRLQPGDSVAIQGAHLTEWLPAAPGRYFTAAAHDYRRFAEGYQAHEIAGQLYDPYGKLNMIQGGIGAFRLNAELGGAPLYYLGLSANGIAHQGIPVVLYQAQYDTILRGLQRAGGCVVDVVGRLQVLPPTLTTGPISYAGLDIPRYCLVLEGITRRRDSLPGELRAAVYVMFASGQDERRQYDQSWTYCTFSPCPEDRHGVTQAVEWLKQFADRYSRLPDPPILTDFDAYHQYFGHRVEFPLAAIWTSRVNTEKLAQYDRPFGRVGHKMLTPAQSRRLAQALVGAFPDPAGLARMVRFHLDANLLAVAGAGTLLECAEKLILWADVADRIPALVQAARAENPENGMLDAVATDFATLYPD